MVSVADEMALDAYLNSLTDLERASFERAAKSRFAHRGYDSSDLQMKYDKGFNDGQRAAKRDADEATRADKPA